MRSCTHINVFQNIITLKQTSEHTEIINKLYLVFEAKKLFINNMLDNVDSIDNLQELKNYIIDVKGPFYAIFKAEVSRKTILQEEIDTLKKKIKSELDQENHLINKLSFAINLLKQRFDELGSTMFTTEHLSLVIAFYIDRQQQIKEAQEIQKWKFQKSGAQRKKWRSKSAKSQPTFLNISIGEYTARFLNEELSAIIMPLIGKVAENLSKIETKLLDVQKDPDNFFDCQIETKYKFNLRLFVPSISNLLLNMSHELYTETMLQLQTEFPTKLTVLQKVILSLPKEAGKVRDYFFRQSSMLFTEFNSFNKVEIEQLRNIPIFVDMIQNTHAYVDAFDYAMHHHCLTVYSAAEHFLQSRMDERKKFQSFFDQTELLLAELLAELSKEPDKLIKCGEAIIP